MRLFFAFILLTSIVFNESIVYASLVHKGDNIAMDLQKENKSDTEQKEKTDEEVKIPQRLHYLEVLAEEECIGRISPSYYFKVHAQPILDIHSPPPELA